MMQTLRNYMKHILWVVALAFIVMLIFSWGMGGFKNRGSEAEQGIIGIVNGQVNIRSKVSIGGQIGLRSCLAGRWPSLNFCLSIAPA